MTEQSINATLGFAALHLMIAMQFTKLGERRTEVAVSARLAALCGVLFASAKTVPLVLTQLGFEPEIGMKYYLTQAWLTDLGYASIVAIPFLSREALITNAAACSLGIVALIVVVDPFVRLMGDGIDLLSIAAVAFAVMSRDEGRNPWTTRALFAASIFYAVPQVIYDRFKDDEMFRFGLSSSAVLFSLTLLVALERGGDEKASAQMALAR